MNRPIDYIRANPFWCFVVASTLATSLYHIYFLFGMKVDDWQYPTCLEALTPLHIRIWAGIVCAWAAYHLAIPFAHLVARIVHGVAMGTFDFFRSAPGIMAAVLFVAFAASISGPMVNNITEQSREYCGFSVGGAKDVNAFRDNVRNNYLPQETSINCEGLFYQYYFDTGARAPATHLFEPTYSCAVSRDWKTNDPEYFLAVGLNSNIKMGDFKRKKLNAVIVLDISGSMSGGFRDYYYDQQNRAGKGSGNGSESDPDADKSKLEVAGKAVCAVIDQLRDGDRFGMVVYDSQAYLAKPMRDVATTDLAAIKSHVMDLRPGSSTNMEDGLEKAREQFTPYLKADKTEYENRIIFLTDAMPNNWDSNSYSVVELARGYASASIHTTFIGIGLDFNTDLIQDIAKVRGANYCAVHSSAEFKRRLGEEFEYLVTPMVFDLTLTMKAQGYEIEKVFGSPDADKATGQIMKVTTLFPAPTKNGESKGGLVLLRLKQRESNAHLSLQVSYQDRNGKQEMNESAVRFLDRTPDYYDNTGIRKGILLSRYVELMKTWISNERAAYAKVHGEPVARPGDSYSAWEQVSVPLHVSATDRAAFAAFSSHFAHESRELQDKTLRSEIEILRMLSARDTAQANPATKGINPWN